MILCYGSPRILTQVLLSKYNTISDVVLWNSWRLHWYKCSRNFWKLFQKMNWHTSWPLSRMLDWTFVVSRLLCSLPKSICSQELSCMLTKNQLCLFLNPFLFIVVIIMKYNNMPYVYIVDKLWVWKESYCFFEK